MSTTPISRGCVSSLPTVIHRRLRGGVLLAPVTWFALLGASHVYAVSPIDTKHPKQWVSGDFFMEACTVVGETAHGMIPHFDCESYIYGVLDALSVSRSLPCVPKQLSPWQVYEAVLSSSPSSTALQQHAATLIVSALRKKYPCK